jgi:hypothetical protein
MIKLLSLCVLTLFAFNSLAASEGGQLFPIKQPIKELTTRPETPKNLDPAPFAQVGTNVVLKWGASEGANQYHLQVATDPNFKWLVYNGETETNTSYALSGLEAGKFYYWRVWSKKSNNDPTYMKSAAFARSVFKTQ